MQRPLDHVGIAVPDLEAAIPRYEEMVGAAATGRERVEAQGVEVAFVGKAAGRLELLAPLSDASPVARFLDRRGPGLHHICYRVPDLAATLREYEAAGYRLIDREPRSGAQGHRVAFVHPSVMGGVLVELLEG